MKRIRSLRDDESGVASTVGTIMALLVFLTFLSLIVNQYVPVWMKDSEAAHMSGAFGQLGTFKGAVDLQILSAITAENAGVSYIPVTTFSPITLGVDGIPIFSGPTVGELRSTPELSPWTTQFVYSIRGVPTKLNESSSGGLTLEVFNRYFIHQTLVYENGAVIRSQFDGQSVRAEPTFVVSVVDNALEISWTQVTLLGQGSVGGTTTEGVHSRLIGVDRQDYTSITSDAWINSTTAYGAAWAGFFNRTLAGTFGVPRERFNDPVYPGYTYAPLANGGQDILTPFYRVRAVFNPTLSGYALSIRIFNDPSGTNPVVGKITAFRIQTAFVSIAIAEKSSEVNL